MLGQSLARPVLSGVVSPGGAQHLYDLASRVRTHERNPARIKGRDSHLLVEHP